MNLSELHGVDQELSPTKVFKIERKKIGVKNCLIVWSTNHFNIDKGKVPKVDKGKMKLRINCNRLPTDVLHLQFLLCWADFHFH